MPLGLIDGLAQRRAPGDGVDIDVLVGGDGPPLLLLHGFPQTRVCWRAVAAELMAQFTLVVPDLRGYGRSDKPRDSGTHETYSKRQMARDQIATMAALGFHEFAVAGHDRGARVAYRLALDHPKAVTKVAVLDILPTLDVWETMNALSSVLMWHWSFLAQRDGLPERLIGQDPEFYHRWLFEHQAPTFAFDPNSLDDYLACANVPASVHGMCEDYRAGWTVDRAQDLEDRGVRQIEAPVLALWGERGLVAHFEPEARWRVWARDLVAKGLPCGHFVPEEAPTQVVESFIQFFNS